MNKLAMAVLLVAGIMAGGMAQAQTALKPKPQKECDEGGSCNNRPEVPKTRALKPKQQKEDCESGCNNHPEEPKTRALKKKQSKECSSSSYCE